ncbi:DNA ligase D [Sphingomonas sp. LY160]|uniref:DNA ligase D n=1 Tax=Sphingomonas sp. LY160 TaxID=3095342 RepID=UPI002ADEB90F|nr:DNA ligase D [Sphingomonas sp. LY160]MEA1071980.1 DNA ligase D [Sphingomonas sp. LY160]
MARRPKLDIETYNAKRDFTSTAEPKGKTARKGGDRFVVQKHDASRLHWDFRLELDGVLKSWAVPKGPSIDPDDKRLAVRTEDHPLDYGTFEGTIPEGEYGGGTVMLWDHGRWIPEPGKDPSKTIEEGHLHFTLEGERMKGEWVMFRLKGRPGEKGENWMLKKVDDAFTGQGEELIERGLTSVTTNRTMEEIAAGKKVAKKRVAAGKKSLSNGLSGKRPAFHALQLATLVDAVPAGSEWIHEYKYDGYRLLLAVGEGETVAWTRNGKDWSDRFAGLVVAATEQLPPGTLIDGEAVALGENGKPNFGLLQRRLKDDGSAELDFFAFDLLVEGGKSLAKLSNLERKARLAALLESASPPLHYADHIVGKGEQLFDAICKEGGEGIISKKASAAYSGRRGRNWLKIKCINRQEFVIIGWTKSDKARGFRSLMLATRDGKTLSYAGKVGTGFTMASMDDLLKKLKAIETDEAAATVPRAEARGAVWVEPKLVAEIAFTEFTSAGTLRHPSFLGLREDKPAKSVKREKAAPLKKAEAKAADHGVTISNRDRVIFPEGKLTKGDLADYYEQVAPIFLRDAANRPMTLVRCPQGRGKQCFFQKHDNGGLGAGVKHVAIKEKDGTKEDYLWFDETAGILGCVQMGTIEFHGWGSRIKPLEKPDRMVFDLDPDVGLDFEAVREGAKQLKQALADIGLVSFAMLSGGKGVHVVVPIDQTATWHKVKSFAERFSRAIAEDQPERFTANIRKAQRKGRIFLDWLRNQRGATAVMPYSARAREHAPVAAPIDWSELDEIDTAARFTIQDADELLARAGSKLLAGWGEADQALPDL